jgi:hypothetical protein
MTPPTPSSTTPRRLLPLIEPALDVLEDRMGGFLQYKTRPAFRQRLQDVLLDETVQWLARPFLLALLQDNLQVARAYVSPHSRPILHWLCQWKYLQHHYHWKGGDDLVLVALRMGAGKTTATTEESVLAQAIQYGSVHTIQHVFQFQAKQGQLQEWIRRESGIENSLAKALDRACPDILQLLLRYISATQRFSTANTAMTALDYILLRLWGWCHQAKPSAEEDCWTILGMPTVEDLGRCVGMLREEGASFTPLGLQILSLFLREDPGEATALQTCCFQLAQRCFRDQDWLHSTWERKPTSREETEQDVVLLLTSPCSLCWNQEEKMRGQPFGTVTLVCGHSYCLPCTREWGSRFSQAHGFGQACPECLGLVTVHKETFREREIREDHENDENNNGVGRMQPCPQTKQNQKRVWFACAKF